MSLTQTGTSSPERNGSEMTCITDWDGRLEGMSQLLDLAATETLSSFRQGPSIATAKSDGTLVTEVDRRTEHQMRAWLANHFPEDGILGEECPPQKGSSSWTWVIDPIDGTASFSHQVPLWGTLLALRRHSKPVAGACALPALNLAASGTIAEAHTHADGETRLITARPSMLPLEEATLVTTGWDYFRMAGVEAAYPALAHRARRTKGWSDCYGLWLLLAGRVDVVVEPLLHPWDIEWLVPLAQAAGIRVTDWHGEDTVSPHQCIVSHGGPLHDQVAEVLKEHATPRVN